MPPELPLISYGMMPPSKQMTPCNPWDKRLPVSNSDSYSKLWIKLEFMENR